MKQMRKKWLGMMCAVLTGMFLLTGCAGGSSLADCFDKETLIKQAKADITLAEGNDYEGWKARFADDLQAQLNEEVYSQYLSSIQELGTFQEFGKTAVIGQEQDGENYAGVVIETDYEDGKIKYVIGYDEEMNLIQFVIQ